MDPTNANTALASAFVEELARCGMRQAVISPGSRSTPLAVALWRQPEIEATVIVDERSASFFALGAAQAGGTPVAMLCTSGTAAANFHPAICEADLSTVPLIALTADRPPELRGIGAGQTIDQLKLFGDAVRWFCEVGTHAADDEGLLHYRATACRAFAVARGEPRPGPVHLNLAWREPLAPIAIDGGVTADDPLALEGRGTLPLTTVAPIDLEPSESILEETARRIGESRSGVIVAGRQLDAGLRVPLARLAAAAGLPILAEPTSQVRFGPHDRTNVIAAYDLMLREPSFAAGVKPDLVLRFGEMPTSKPLRRWIAASGADQIVVDPFGGWNEPSRRAGQILRADPSVFASGWAARLAGEGREPPARWLRAELAARDAIGAVLGEADELSEPALHGALGEAHRGGDLVYTASSMPIRDQEAYLPSREADVLFLCNRGANGIDGLVSSGAGAAAASGLPTTIVTGDIGLLHDIGGLAALGASTTPVRIVVIDNDGGGIFHFLPQRKAMSAGEFEALLGTPRGVGLARAAELFGLPHRRLESLADLPAALGAGTGVIEVPVKPRSGNVDLHARIGTRVGESLADL